MRMTSSLLLLCASTTNASVRKPRIRDEASTTDGLTIKTSSGELHGFVNTTAPNVRQFLGIPYAQPPVGSLRFMPPQPFTSSEQRETVAYAPSCMQQTSGSKSVYTEYMQQFLIEGGQSEDCLYLNVYAPAVKAAGEKVPVFIYIPGGGFTSGGANSLYKIPDKWVERTQGLVVITMNYRLNVFGFPSARAQFLNAGLLDQRMVVEWAKANIAAFGGDPDQMILWGQSAGAASVGYYAYAYPEDPIVKGFIADSGAPGMLLKTDTNHTSFTTLAGTVGCNQSDAAGELACMQKVDATVLENALINGNGISFGPFADEVTAFANSTDRAATGLLANLSMIMGSNANEGAGFGQFNESGMSPGQYQAGLNSITCPVAAEVGNRETYGYTTYRYEYSGNFSNISPRPWIGATHSAELPLLFGTHYEYRGNSTEFEWDVSYGMEALWLSFAANPTVAPTDGQGLTWPKYSSQSDSMALFAADDKVMQLVSGSTVDSLCN